MLQIVRLVTVLSGFTALAFAESWSGTLVDVMCKAKNVSGHTRQCALSERCSGSGFGIALANDTFLKFDTAGSAKAHAILKASQKEKDLMINVTGALKDGVIQVETIEFQ